MVDQPDQEFYEKATACMSDLEGLIEELGELRRGNLPRSKKQASCIGVMLIGLTEALHAAYNFPAPE